MNSNYKDLWKTTRW